MLVLIGVDWDASRVRGSFTRTTALSFLITAFGPGTTSKRTVLLRSLLKRTYISRLVPRSVGLRIVESTLKSMVVLSAAMRSGKYVMGVKAMSVWMPAARYLSSRSFRVTFPGLDELIFNGTRRHEDCPHVAR